MARYIELDALLDWAKETYLCENASAIRKVCYKQLVEHLNTLEVKEIGVDLGDPKGDKSAKYIIDTKNLEVKEVQEEPVSKELEDAAYQFGNCFENHFELASMSFIKGAQWQKEQDLTPSTELSNFIDKLSKQFPEVSFAKLSRIAVRVAKWQQQQEYTCYEEAFEDGAKWKAEQFEEERLKHCEDLTEAQAEIESDFVTQHLKENKRTPTFIDAIEYGMEMMKEQMMKDAFECEVKVDAGGYPYIPQIELYDYDKDEPLAKEGDKYKVILIEED